MEPLAEGNVMDLFNDLDEEFKISRDSWGNYVATAPNGDRFLASEEKGGGYTWTTEEMDVDEEGWQDVTSVTDGSSSFAALETALFAWHDSH